MRENMVLFWKKLNYFYLILVLFCFGQMEQEQEQQERRARAMRLKMNQSDLWRWALRGIVIDAIEQKKSVTRVYNTQYESH